MEDGGLFRRRLVARDRARRIKSAPVGRVDRALSLARQFHMIRTALERFDVFPLQKFGVALR